MEIESTGINTLSAEQRALLIGSEYTGNDAGAAAPIPPQIKILGSDKQYKFFPGARGLSDHHGELFISNPTGNNSVDDLKPEITINVLRIAVGCEVRIQQQDHMGTLQWSQRKMINAREAELWKARHPGLEYSNMIRIIGTQYSPAEVSMMVANGDNPFCLLTIDGDKWGGWIDAQKEMRKLAGSNVDYNHAPVHKLLVSVWKLKLTSELVKGERFSWYVFDIGVTMNDPQTALGLQPFVEEFRAAPPFYKLVDPASGEIPGTVEPSEPAEEGDLQSLAATEPAPRREERVFDDNHRPVQEAPSAGKLALSPNGRITFQRALDSVRTQEDMEMLRNTYPSDYFTEFAEAVKLVVDANGLLPF